MTTSRRRTPRATSPPTEAPPPKPFTLAHWLAWASQLVLDTGEKFKPEEFQVWFVEDLFTGATECWFILPEGNGKTTLIAAIALYHIEFTREAWVPVAAASREQAEILYRQGAGFVRRSPSLRGRFMLYDGYRKIVFGTKRSVKDDDALAPKMQIFAADERTGDGVIPSLAIIDEPHRQASMGLYRTWYGKLGKRKGAQIVAISVAGEPGSEFEEARANLRRVAKPIKQSPTFLRIRTPDVVYHEWSVPEKGNVEDIALVKRANPFSGITVETLRKKRRSPTMILGHWSRMTCNLPVRGENAAISATEWHGAEAAERIPEGEQIWAGLDIGWKQDTTALVALWTPEADRRFLGPATVLTPPRDGTSLPVADVKRAIRDLNDRTPIHTLVMDTTRAEDIYDWAQSELGLAVIDRSQNNAFAAADYERFMEALRNGWLKHSGDAALRSHALNAIAARLENGKVKFERPSQSRFGGQSRQNMRVIDALQAAAMVHGVAAAELDTPAAAWSVA